MQEYKGLLRKATNSMDDDVDPIQMQSKFSAAKKSIDPEPVSLADVENDLRLGKQKLDLKSIRKIQIQQQAKLDNIGSIVKELTNQMRDFIQQRILEQDEAKQSTAEKSQKSRTRPYQSEGRALKQPTKLINNYMAQNSGRNVAANDRARSKGARVGGGGRVVDRSAQK